MPPSTMTPPPTPPTTMPTTTTPTTPTTPTTHRPIYAVPTTKPPTLHLPSTATTGADFSLQLSLYLNAKRTRLSPNRQALSFSPMAERDVALAQGAVCGSYKMPYIHATAHFDSPLAEARALAFWADEWNCDYLQCKLDVLAGALVDLGDSGVQTRITMLVTSPQADDDADLFLESFVLCCHETVVTLTVFEHGGVTSSP
ncbi:uncharacterized protein LOC62_03G005143 [Vanrija pseudolonga]|uniref:Uncharacterized protein n=1 Tax=Vanrija pseudolonga TaxID=143232 RepID=A0AAF0Y7Q5_9TREE|nr:hypothetical protein LOC62_03G005143 [Vanrija pseudolonga]